jgi:hypothetical protein
VRDNARQAALRPRAVFPSKMNTRWQSFFFMRR